MSNFSGISAILSVSLVALMTIQLLKDKFEMVENYGELDEQGNNLHQGDAYYTHTTLNSMNGVQDRPRAMAPINDLSKLKHGGKPNQHIFVAGRNVDTMTSNGERLHFLFVEPNGCHRPQICFFN